MGSLVSVGRRHIELPRAPVEIADAVELYAREGGRHASMDFVPTLFINGRVARGTWRARFSLRGDDKRLLAHKEGRAPEPPTEDVWFHESNPDAGELIPGTYGQREPPFRALNIVELGASGVRHFLQRGNMWSGRGQFASLEEQARKVREHNEEMRAAFRQEQKEKSRNRQRDKRRWRFKIPFLPVEIDLKRKTVTQGDGL